MESTFLQAFDAVIEYGGICEMSKDKLQMLCEEIKNEITRPGLSGL